MTANKAENTTPVENVRGFAKTYTGMFQKLEYLTCNNMGERGMIWVMVKDEGNEVEEDYSVMTLPMDVAVELANFILAEAELFKASLEKLAARNVN